MMNRDAADAAQAMLEAGGAQVDALRAQAREVAAKQAADNALIEQPQPARPHQISNAEFVGDVLQPDNDYLEATAFLRGLDPTATAFTFQGFYDSKNATPEEKADPTHRPWVLHGSIEELWPQLVAHNANGMGVYVTVQETDLNGRRNANIIRVRALIRDLDTPCDNPLPIAPSLTLESSPGKFQDFFRVDGLPLDEFTGFQERLIADYGCDANVKDLARVMRVPGFLHLKNPDAPFRVRLVSDTSAQYLPWGVDALRDALPPVIRAPDAPLPAYVTDKADTEELMRAVKCIDPNRDPDRGGYMEWIHVGMALHLHDPSMMDFFNEWSRGDFKEGSTPHYPDGGYEEIKDKWRSFGIRQGKLVTPRTIFSMARKEGYFPSPNWSEALTASMTSGEIDLITATRNAPDALEFLMGVVGGFDVQTSKDERNGVLTALLELDDPVEIEKVIRSISDMIGASITSIRAAFKPIKERRDREEMKRVQEERQQQVQVKAAAQPGDLSIRSHIANEITEFGNVARMMAKYGNVIRYESESGTWLVWSGTRWETKPENIIEFFAKQTIAGLSSELNGIANASDRADFMRFMMDSEKKTMVNSMVKLMKSEAGIVVFSRALDADSNLLGVQNGYVDLTTGQFMPPDLSKLITKSTGCDWVPGSDCPIFKQTILEILMNDAEVVDFMQRLIGYIILGDPTEDIMAICFGDGSNGKSTLLNLIKKILGSYAVVADAETFMGTSSDDGGKPREDLLRLKGARLVLCSEPEKGQRLREAFVKKMTGGDPIVARGQRALKSIEFLPTWTPVMPTNHKPVISGDDYGIWRRILAIPFSRNFDKDKVITKDVKRSKALEAEMPGVLAWMVEGSIKYRDQGLNIPEKIKAERDTYRNQMDIVSQWLLECTESSTTGEPIPTPALYSSWKAWAEANGYKFQAGTSVALSQKLNKRYAQVQQFRINGKGKKHRSGFVGLTINAPQAA